MNEYLTTQLGQDHRNTLLAEAKADHLARLARAGRPMWWQRLTARITTSATDQSAHEPQAQRQDHHLAA